MSAVDQTITLLPVEPATPIVLCNSQFLSTLAQVEREAASLAVSDPQAQQSASTLLQRLTTAGKALEDARTRLKAPFIAKGKEIDEAARAPATRIETAKGLVKRKIAEYAEAVAKAEAEAERKRQAEIARLAEIARKEETERQRKAAEMARQAKIAAEATKAQVIDVDFDDEPAAAPPPKTETELALERLQHTPAPVAAKPAGIAFKTWLVIDKIDVAKLPEPFVTKTANERALRATYCTGWKDGDPLPECPGVTFKIDRQVASTGRAVF